MEQLTMPVPAYSLRGALQRVLAATLPWCPGTLHFVRDGRYPTTTKYSYTPTPTKIHGTMSTSSMRAGRARQWRSKSAPTRLQIMMASSSGFSGKYRVASREGRSNSHDHKSLIDRLFAERVCRGQG